MGNELKVVSENGGYVIYTTPAGRDSGLELITPHKGKSYAPVPVPVSFCDAVTRLSLLPAHLYGKDLTIKFEEGGIPFNDDERNALHWLTQSLKKHCTRAEGYFEICNQINSLSGKVVST